MLPLTIKLDDTRVWHVRCGDRTLGSSSAIEFAIFAARETARQLAQDTDPLMSQAWQQMYDDLTSRRLRHNQLACACDACEGHRDDMKWDAELEARETYHAEPWA